MQTLLGNRLVVDQGRRLGEIGEPDLGRWHNLRNDRMKLGGVVGGGQTRPVFAEQLRNGVCNPYVHYGILSEKKYLEKRDHSNSCLIADLWVGAVWLGKRTDTVRPGHRAFA